MAFRTRISYLRFSYSDAKSAQFRSAAAIAAIAKVIASSAQQEMLIGQRFDALTLWSQPRLCVVMVAGA
jgi:hypothetical protein